MSCPFLIVSRSSPQPAGYRSGLELRGEAWGASALLCSLCSARARSLSLPLLLVALSPSFCPTTASWLIAPLCRVRVTGLGLGRAVDSPPLTSSIRVDRTSSALPGYLHRSYPPPRKYRAAGSGLQFPPRRRQLRCHHSRPNRARLTHPMSSLAPGLPLPKIQ